MMKADKSILISRVCLLIFLILLILFDVFAWPVAAWFAEKSAPLSEKATLYRYFLSATIYLCSVPAYIALWHMNRLLKNLSGGVVFTRANVLALRYTCWCLTAACVVLALSAIYYLPFLLVSLCAGFMALIVHIVKNVFEKAVLMQDELDLTV